MTIEYVNAIRGKCIEAGMPDADGRHMMTLEVEFFDLRDFPHNPLMADFVMLSKDQFDRLVEPLREQLCKRLHPDRAVAVDAKAS